MNRKDNVIIMDKSKFDNALMTNKCHECLRRRGGCQVTYDSDDCKRISKIMLDEK